MRRVFAGPIAAVFLLFLLTGCHAVGDKAASISVVYGATALLSLLMLLGYCCIVKKKDPWFVLLFASVMVVNIGYFLLAVSRGLDEALLANRLAYLGSVFLPLAMWMIILNVTNIQHPKWMTWALFALGFVMFFIAASPGYLDIYYKEVTFEKINGVTVLNKVYGPLHGLYLLYLLGYFGAMVVTIVHATLIDKIDSLAYAAILAIAVFVNIGVWLIEQLVRIDFEILSVSYIISESFLLGLHLLMAENEKNKVLLPTETPQEEPASEPAAEPVEHKDTDQMAIDCFLSGISELTGKERMIYDCYIAGLSTAEIMEKLNIKENTLKFHNKNIYNKLGVSSRKQLVGLHKRINGK